MINLSTAVILTNYSWWLCFYTLHILHYITYILSHKQDSTSHNDYNIASTHIHKASSIHSCIEEKNELILCNNKIWETRQHTLVSNVSADCNNWKYFSRWMLLLSHQVVLIIIIEIWPIHNFSGSDGDDISKFYIFILNIQYWSFFILITLRVLWMSQITNNPLDYFHTLWNKITCHLLCFTIIAENYDDLQKSICFLKQIL